MSALLLQRFLESVARVPDKTALASRDREVDYASLGRMAAAAAARLSRITRPGDRIAILGESTPEYVAVLYGAWSAGLTVVGLNPALRGNELAGLARHAEVAAAVVDPAHAEASALGEALANQASVMTLDEATSAEGRATKEWRPIEPTSGDLAQIIYTSGTTGNPKGVMLTHGNLAANTASIQESLPIDTDDRALCVLPFQYSYGSSVLHTHLSLGATVLLERSLMYPRTVLDRMTTERATSLAGVPSTFHLLMDRTDLGEHDLSALRYVTQAGGRMDPERITKFRASVPGADFFVMYGQTEASARLACLPPEDLSRKSGSVGRAIAGVRLSVRGDDGMEMPEGRQGEVWAQGANVMLGYWKDPAGTAAVLVDGWLRTGDLGHMDEDGYVFLEGRARDFIKSGAYRIAPAEIEDVIRSVEGVRDVAVVGRQDPMLGEAIHAYVLAPVPGPELERAVMRACVQRLARFKLPHQIHFRGDFPRTASGKIQKHLL
jgi:acyl-CoA synthetase (AMP-forming)/AMP-acid ligase II